MADSAQHKVVLRDEQNGGSSHLTASIADSGDLVFSGQIISKALEEALGDNEYEYWLTVRSQHVPSVLLELIKDRFKDDTDFKQWLETKGIPGEIHSWS